MRLLPFFGNSTAAKIAVAGLHAGKLPAVWSHRFSRFSHGFTGRFPAVFYRFLPFSRFIARNVFSSGCRKRQRRKKQAAG
jgi:hypothetical protein